MSKDVFVTWELIKCQKAFNALNDKLKTLINEVNHHRENGHKELSAQWIIDKLEWIITP